ncbi:MAG UNVERIFIED_CONTAM: antitoxin family protein [Microcystis novacekii LVE1205-3]
MPSRNSGVPFVTEFVLHSLDCKQLTSSPLTLKYGVFPMPQALKAIYHSGTFILKTACDLPEGIEVELFVKSPQVVSPKDCRYCG